MKEIIKALKKYPDYNINQIALKLGVPSHEVAEAQREYYKQFIKRDNKMWGKQGEAIVSYNQLAELKKQI